MEEFVKGDQVEVCSKEEGYLGSYFEARVLSKLPNGFSYKVKYKKLMTKEDHSLPLIQIVNADELRPMPPRTMPEFFYISQKVDVFIKDGWWLGEVTDRRRGGLYYVYFPTSGRERQFQLHSLRRHLDFVNGHWFSSPV